MMWQFAVCAVQFLFMITHLCNILSASVSVCCAVCLCGDGWSKGGGRMSFIYVVEDCGIRYITQNAWPAYYLVTI